MKRLMAGIGFVVFLWPTNSDAQSGAVTHPSDAARASQASCVILKRLGRIGRTESRLSHFGISGKQFRYVEGKLPEGFSFREKMTDNNVRNLQARGSKVLVLDSHYTPQDLQEARANCRGEAGKTSIQAEEKASPATASAPMASAPATTPKPLTASAAAPAPEAMVSASAPASRPPAAKVPTPKEQDPTFSTGTEAALLDVSSTPTEADVFVDDHLSGRTPSTLILMPGDHQITIKKNGFEVWKRKLKLSSGRSNLDAQLFPKAK